jgi:hypothetical protein
MKQALAWRASDLTAEEPLQAAPMARTRGVEIMFAHAP